VREASNVCWIDWSSEVRVSGTDDGRMELLIEDEELGAGEPCMLVKVAW
jgi:hypothetical protein